MNTMNSNNNIDNAMHRICKDCGKRNSGNRTEPGVIKAESDFTDFPQLRDKMLERSCKTGFSRSRAKTCAKMSGFSPLVFYFILVLFASSANAQFGRFADIQVRLPGAVWIDG